VKDLEALRREQAQLKREVEMSAEVIKKLENKTE
jgi:hypothetical protein